MKKIALLLALPVALSLAGCGSTTDATTSFTVATGTYAPSGATATTAYPADNCNVVSFFATGADPFPMAVAADGKSANLNFSSTNDAAHTETITITGNAIAGTVDANFQTVWTGTLCTTITKVKVVSGELTANNDMHLVVQYDITAAVGATCTPVDVDAKLFPCTSQVDFLAKKQ